MKKSWLILLLLLALSGSLIGCANGEAKEALLSAMTKSLTVQKISGAGTIKLTSPAANLQAGFQLAVDLPGRKATIDLDLNIDGTQLSGQVIQDGDKLYVKTPYFPQYLYAQATTAGGTEATPEQGQALAKSLITAIEQNIPNRLVKQASSRLTIGGQELPVTKVTIAGISSDQLIKVVRATLQAWLDDPALKQQIIGALVQGAAASGTTLTAAQAEQQLAAVISSLNASSISLISFSYDNYIDEDGNIVKSSINLQDGSAENNEEISVEFSVEKLNEDVTVEIPTIRQSDTIDLQEFVQFFLQAQAQEQ